MTVEQHFPNHPGSLENFIWPVTREEALKFLDDFIANKLAGFGDHQDAMWQATNSSQSPYLWHSLLSTSLNLKLLNPREVIAAAVAAYQKHQLPLSQCRRVYSANFRLARIYSWRVLARYATNG